MLIEVRGTFLQNLIEVGVVIVLRIRPGVAVGRRHFAVRRVLEKGMETTI